MRALDGERKGFTLIELLVVVALISLLSSVVMASLNSARAKARDTRRVADIKNIQKALEIYYDRFNTLPVPTAYGRGNVSPGYWDTWWDLSSNTASPGFLNFLVTSGVMTTVPIDPLNTPAANGDPREAGYRYFYFVAPKAYMYQGGSCVATSSHVYLLGISDLETETTRPPTKFSGSGCSCLWQLAPNMFQAEFDYMVCNSF